MPFYDDVYQWTKIDIKKSLVYRRIMMKTIGFIYNTSQN